MFGNSIVGRFDGPGLRRGEYIIPFTKPTTTQYITIQQKGKHILQINGLKFNEEFKGRIKLHFFSKKLGIRNRGLEGKRNLQTLETANTKNTMS